MKEETTRPESRIIAKLRELRFRDPSRPSVRQIAERAEGHVSHTTVANVLNHGRTPSQSSMIAIAVALDAKQADLNELSELWDARQEALEGDRRQVRRLPKVNEAVVIHPGDTIIFSVDQPDMDSEGLAGLESALAAMYPDNRVTVINGASVAVVRCEPDRGQHALPHRGCVLR